MYLQALFLKSTSKNKRLVVKQHHFAAAKIMLEAQSQCRLTLYISEPWPWEPQSWASRGMGGWQTSRKRMKRPLIWVGPLVTVTARIMTFGGFGILINLPVPLLMDWWEGNNPSYHTCVWPPSCMAPSLKGCPLPADTTGTSVPTETHKLQIMAMAPGNMQASQDPEINQACGLLRKRLLTLCLADTYRIVAA